MRRPTRSAILWGVVVLSSMLAVPVQGAPVASEVVSDVCPGDVDTSLGLVPLPAWVDLCGLTLSTPALGRAPTVQFSIRVAGDLASRLPTAFYRVSWNISQEPSTDHCTQALSFDQTHNRLDPATGTWRAWLWDHTCPATGIKSTYTEISSDQITVTDNTITILASSPSWAPQTRFDAIEVRTGVDELNLKGDDSTRPPGEEGHLHGNFEIPADRADGGSYNLTPRGRQGR